MTILDQIVAYKRTEVVNKKLRAPLSILEKSKLFSRDPFSLKSGLLAKDKSGIIAEFKRRSPSKGMLNRTADVADTIRAYKNAGASACSVLTDTKFFGGSYVDLEAARQAADLPLLRKDFIVDGYQVAEARSMGADAVLLIAAVLEESEIFDFTKMAHDLGLEVLVELHDEKEIDKLSGIEDVIGINNRNLKTFEVNLEHSMMLAELLPKDCVKVSESGIRTPEDILKLKKAGFSGFLIGELFMRESDPGKECENFILQLNSKSKGI